jgi:hypothetical protein
VGHGLSCLEAYYVNSQHLSCERMVYGTCNDLLPIRRGFAIIDLAIVTVSDPDEYGSAGRHDDGCLEVLLIDGVPDRRIVVQPVSLFGF